jgi:hypothetical protein
MKKIEKLMELAKSKKDPIYAIEKYLETEDRTQGGYVPFKLFPKQKLLVEGYKIHDHNIVMKPRQAGISTTTAAFLAIIVALAAKESPEKVLIAANKQETAKEFLKKIKDFIQQLPMWMDVNRPPGSENWFDKEKNSSSHIKLNNGCEIKAVASSKDALRGYTPSYIVIDEAAFIEGSKGEEFYSAAQPSLSTGGKSILISTPNGYDPLYHKTYIMAQEGENNFNIVDMKWYEDPRYNKGMKWIKEEGIGDDITIEEKIEFDKEKWDDLVKEGFEPTSPWFEKMCAQLNHNSRMIAQELLCSFLGSGDQVIDDKWVKRQEKENVIEEPLRKEWMDGKMWIWEDPIEGHEYILSADASSGSAADFAGLVIWDFTTGNQVAEYHGKVTPDILGEIAYYYGDAYDAFIVVDITGGWGANTVLKLIDLGYPTKKMFYDTVIGVNAVENNKAIQKHIKNGKLPGLNFQKNRNTIVSDLEKAIRMDTFKVRSIRALNEMDTFVFLNGRPDHMKGYHDDLLMSIAMCVYVGNTSFKDLEKSKGRTKAMINSWVTTESGVDEIDGLKDVVGGFHVDNKPNPQQQMNENMWVFGGMKGFKGKR